MWPSIFSCYPFFFCFIILFLSLFADVGFHRPPIGQISRLFHSRAGRKGDTRAFSLFLPLFQSKRHSLENEGRNDRLPGSLHYRLYAYMHYRVQPPARRTLRLTLPLCPPSFPPSLPPPHYTNTQTHNHTADTQKCLHAPKNIYYPHHFSQVSQTTSKTKKCPHSSHSPFLLMPTGH